MNKLQKEFRERISGYVIGAFGLVASLAWNDAISSLILRAGDDGCFGDYCDIFGKVAKKRRRERKITQLK